MHCNSSVRPDGSNCALWRGGCRLRGKSRQGFVREIHRLLRGSPSCRQQLLASPHAVPRWGAGVAGGVRGAVVRRLPARADAPSPSLGSSLMTVCQVPSMPWPLGPPHLPPLLHVHTPPTSPFDCGRPPLRHRVGHAYGPFPARARAYTRTRARPSTLSSSTFLMARLAPTPLPPIRPPLNPTPSTTRKQHALIGPMLTAGAPHPHPTPHPLQCPRAGQLGRLVR